MKKILSLLICITLLLSTCSIMSFAVTHELPAVTVDALEFPGERPSKDNIVRADRFWSNGSNSHLYYNQLNSAAKAVYDAIVDARAGLDTNGHMALSFPNHEIQGSTSNLGTVLSNAAIQALSALMDDYPEYFWIGGFGYSGASYTMLNSSTAAITAIGDFYFADGISDTSNYASFAEVKSSYNQMINIVNNFNVNGFNRYEKVKSIHDQIADMTTYNEAAMAHHPTGVLLNGVAVCEGYAEAFKLICDREGIPCIIIVGDGYTNGGSGEGHEWNAVQMDDGKWYGLDVTWDDQGSSGRTYYDYFLVGSNSPSSNSFGNRAWSVSHVADGVHFSSNGFALAYPTLASSSYSAIMPFYNTDVTFDAQRLMAYIGKDANLSFEFWITRIEYVTQYSYYDYTQNAPSDNAASISGVTTGATITITSPVSRVYTVARWGDVNADNNVNDMDKDLIKGVALCQSTISGTAENAAADFNHDGVIDGFDAIYMELYLKNAVSK